MHTHVNHVIILTDREYHFWVLNTCLFVPSLRSNITQPDPKWRRGHGKAPELSGHKEFALACTCCSVSAVTCSNWGQGTGSEHRWTHEHCKRPKDSIWGFWTHDSWPKLVAFDYLIGNITNFTCFSIRSCLKDHHSITILVTRDINHHSMAIQSP